MKIITTVGTSLVTNIINPLRNRCNLTTNEKKALDDFNALFKQNYNQKKNHQKEYIDLTSFIKKNISFHEKISAEIKSIIAIKENEKFKNSSIEIELLATDSILSPLCSEILKELIEKNSDFKVSFDEKNIISDLQVSDYNRYKKGLINLLNRLNQIASNGKYFGDLALNVTGGFKGIIPYMTIYGQVNKIPIYYIFEFTSALIEIPQMPLRIDDSIFEKNWQIFYEIDINDVVEKNKLNFNFILDHENLLEIEGDMVSLNPLGKILWDKYRRENFIFYTTKEISEEIRKQKNIQNILKEKFYLNYYNKTEQKNNHFVYDDGNNPYRIFYFKEKNNFYIYKTFENHDKYEKYLNDPNSKLVKDEFIHEAKLVMF